MKKYLLLTLLIILSVVIGCAGMQSSERTTFRHQLELMVHTEGDGIIGEPQKYSLPDSPYLHPSALTKLSSDGEAYVQIFSSLSVSDYTRTYNDFLYLEKETDIRDVHILINSPGGDAFSGMALADTIVKFRNRGFRITAYGSGIIASAAVPVFAVCSPRIAAPGTMFMVHEAALWKWPGRETSSDIRAQSELMAELQNRYISYLPKNKVSINRWVELIKMTTWFNVTKAQEWGLVDKIE